MEDQRDLISNHEQLPMLGQRPGAPESKCSRGALYTGFSVLVALLLAGQATTAYFLYQQQGRLDKLTVTSQNLQLESLRMKLPKPPKPLSKMRVATPMMMQALPIQSLPQGPTQNATEYGNMTQDHVMHLLLEADPLKVYPKLKGSFPENLKHLKNTMETLDWKVFENWMYQWLLFEMSKNSLEKKSTEVPLKALTKCQEEVSRIPDVHPGTFRPQCDENGNYKPLQCFGSTGYCWCVFPNGTEVPHTRSHGHHNCSGKQCLLGQGVSEEQKDQEGTRGAGHSSCGRWGAATQLPLCPSTSSPACALICSSILLLLTSTHLPIICPSVPSFIADAPAAVHHPQCTQEPAGPPISRHHSLPWPSPTTPGCCHPTRVLPFGTCSQHEAGSQAGKDDPGPLSMGVGSWTAK